MESDSDTLWVSIDGLKETHDLLRGKSFDEIMRNIERSTHQKIFAHITINRVNQEDIPQLVRFISDKVRGITFQFHYPYSGESDPLLLTSEERILVLDELIRLKRRGLPLANSYACLQALKDNRWKCHSWMMLCCGQISCEKCGFSAHTEISLAYDGVLESIRAGRNIFLSSMRSVHA